MRFSFQLLSCSFTRGSAADHASSRADQLRCDHCGQIQGAGHAGRLRKHLESCPDVPRGPVPIKPGVMSAGDKHRIPLDSWKSQTLQNEGKARSEHTLINTEVAERTSLSSDEAHMTVDKTKHELSAVELEKLSASCIQAKTRAYCPYSNFRVGATFLSTSGTYISGANVENAAYSVGVCAERCALGAAVASAGMRRGDFKALGIATDIKPGASPCGMCRQGLREFCEDSMPIYMHDREGNYIVRTLGELLPMSFGPDDLPPPSRAQQRPPVA